MSLNHLMSARPPCSLPHRGSIAPDAVVAVICENCEPAYVDLMCQAHASQYARISKVHGWPIHLPCGFFGPYRIEDLRGGNSNITVVPDLGA